MINSLQDKNKRTMLALSAIVGAGLILRIIYIVQLGRSDIGSVLPLDMVFYRDLAVRINSGGGLPGGAISFNPLYPFFLAAVRALSGGSIFWPRTVQAFTGLLTLLVIFVAGRRIALPSREKGIDPDLTGLVAAASALLYSQFLLYEGALLATSLVTFLLSLSFALTLIIDQDRRGIADHIIFSRKVPLPLSAFILGVAGGLGALGRPNFFLLLLPLVAAYLFLADESRKRGLMLALCCAAGVFIILLPPTIYNAAETGRLVPVSTHGGINFYIGNRSGATGIYRPPDGMRSDMRGLLEDARMLAERESGRSLSDSEASDYWMSRAVESIVTDPAGYARLLGRKAMLFWNGTEVSDIVEVSIFRKECPVLSVLFLPFTLISALALPGIALLLFLRRNRVISLLFVLAGMASIMLFYINSRYRVPVVPVLIVIASLFVSWTVSRLFRHCWKEAATAIVSAILVLFLVSGRDMVRVDKSAAYTFLGNHYMEKGEMEKGEEAFAEAHRMAPGLVMTNINYGRVLLRKGDLGRSRELYASAFAIDPSFPMLAVEFGSLLDQAGDKDEAVEKFHYALGLGRARDSVMACQFLSQIAYREGKREEAAEWIRRALEIVPGDERLLGLLNRLAGDDS